MKSGAGDDPFADIFDAEDAETEDTQRSEASEASTEERRAASSAADSVSPTATDHSAEASDDDPEIPWIFKREKVKSDRDKVHQLFVRPETDRTYRRFESDLEEAMDTDLSRLDVREAAYLVGMQHPELVISVLESWGYNYFD